MTDWIFQFSGKGKRSDLEAALQVSPPRSCGTPRYRDRTAAGDRVWVQVVAPNAPGLYYQGAIVAPTYEDPEWQGGESSLAPRRGGITRPHPPHPPPLRGGVA